MLEGLAGYSIGRLKVQKKNFDPKSYEALLVLDVKEIEKNFPDVIG